jgi:hypothetical protein
MAAPPLIDTLEMARNFEAALKRAGKPVESKCLQNAGHNAFFSDSTQRRSTTRGGILPKPASQLGVAMG